MRNLDSTNNWLNPLRLDGLMPTPNPPRKREQPRMEAPKSKAKPKPLARREPDLTPIHSLEALLASALKHVAEVRKKADDGVARLHLLESDGLDFARPAYQGDYLYRTEPTVDGKRRRVYVGAASDKTAAALAAMERGKKYTEEVAALRALARQAALALRPAQRLLDYLEALRSA